MLPCLYLTEIKPSRSSARAFAAWLKDNYPACSFTEINVDRKSEPRRNGGGYLGRVEAPEGWADSARAPDRQAVFEAARRMLAS